MAIVDVPKKGIRLTSAHEIHRYLSRIGIDYAHWEHLDPVSADATDQEILDAYSKEIDELKEKGGYVTADVINVITTTPGLDELLANVNRENWHDEDEIRFIAKSHGVFNNAPKSGAV